MWCQGAEEGGVEGVVRAATHADDEGVDGTVSLDVTGELVEGFLVVFDVEDLCCQRW